MWSSRPLCSKPLLALGLVAAQHRFSTYYINCHQLIEQLSMSEVKSIIFRYIHYYNRRRIYSTNGGLPPLVFRQAFLPACVALFPLWVLTELLLTFHSASICSDLKKRGVRNVFIACHDNLKGLGDAINAVFSEAKQQLCIVHQVRNSAKFVPWKDRKAVCADLKKIYSAVNLDAAEYAKEEFREKWDQKYPSILRSWDTNWAELTTFFAYPEQIRHLIYTTNGVEAYHRMVRKFTKAKAIFPTDDSIRKVVYLSVKEITKSGPCRCATGVSVTARSWYSLQTGLLLEGRSTCRWIRGLRPRTPEVYPFRHSGEMETGKQLLPAGSPSMPQQSSGRSSALPCLCCIFIIVFIFGGYSIYTVLFSVPRKPNFICSSRWRIWFWLTGVAWRSDSGALRGLLTVL